MSGEVTSIWGMDGSTNDKAAFHEDLYIKGMLCFTTCGLASVIYIAVRRCLLLAVQTGALNGRTEVLMLIRTERGLARIRTR